MTNTPKLRVGDTVTVRGVVVSTTDGSTRNAYPAVKIGDRVFRDSERLDIVEHTRALRVGDRVRLVDVDESGTVVALSPADVEPAQAWVRLDGRWSLASKQVSTLRRVDP